MRNTRRWAALLTASLLLLSGAVWQMGSADAVLPLTLAGSAPSAVHGPGAVTFSYSIDLPSDIGSAVLTTHQATALPALVTAVTIDGLAVPAGQISRPDSGDIAVQTGPAATDGLVHGHHVFTFTADVSAGPSAVTSSSATLAFTESAIPIAVTSAPVLVSVNQPDIAVVLTPGSGEDQLGFLGTGEDLILAVDVANLGYGTPRSSLTIDLPVGTALGADGVIREADGSSLTCQPGVTPQRIVCDLGNLSHAGSNNSTLDIDLTTSGAEPIGQVATVSVSASPNAGEGTDTAPANDSVTAQFQFTGSARLSYTITPAKTKVALGQQISVKLTVHNAGPQPANETIAFGVLVGNNFDITSFTGNTTPPSSLTGGVTTGAIPPTMNGVFWFVGDIPAGHSVSAVLNIRARTVGTTRVGLLAISTAADLNCPNLNCDLTSVPVQAILAPVVPASAPTRTSPAPTVASSNPLQLANTGAASTPALALGCLLLVLGMALTYTSRRPQ
ncbi:MAG: hypothetical protein QOE71_43 [Pseudonocardiales bacterium]|nr:hypothetical protein [Pseudonocardiales bacterium]